MRKAWEGFVVATSMLVFVGCSREARVAPRGDSPSVVANDVVEQDDAWMAWAASLAPGGGRTADSIGFLEPELRQAVGEDILVTPLPHDHQKPTLGCEAGPCSGYGPEMRVIAAKKLGIWSAERDFDKERDVGVLMMFEGGSYESLGLSGVKKGDNFGIRLQRIAVGAGFTWSAKLVRKATTITLQVARTKYPAQGDTLKPPPVARFARLGDGWMGIGIQCADGWCVLSTDSTSKPSEEVACAGRDNTCTVPGWGDEQELSTVNSGVLERSGVVAKVFPVPELGTFRRNDMALKGDFMRVAFTKTATGTYKKPTRGTSIREGELTEVQLLLKPTALDDRYDYRAKFKDNAGNDVFEMSPKLEYDKHSDVLDRGTVRWRWNPNDEGLWIRCPAGCCKVKTF